MKKVVIHSDGGCSGNPGPGGWAAILGHGPYTPELSGGEWATTNNRMELRAAIEALNALKKPCEVQFFTDSEYVRNGITSWVAKWKLKGWKRGTNPVKNEDLWRALDSAAAGHKIKWHWAALSAEFLQRSWRLCCPCLQSFANSVIWQTLLLQS